MSRVTFDNINDPALRRRVMAADAKQNAKRPAAWPNLWTETTTYQGKLTKKQVEDIAQNVPTPRQPNQTEREALRALDIHSCDFMHEGRTFVLPGNSDYTPDWTSPNTCIEVKGGFKHFNRGRSLLAFHAARELHPEIRWILCEQKKGGKRGSHWDVKIWERKV